ncbi:MAG: LysR family transcriptional regulator [Rhizobiaceae bacterium]|nr:LysR family transcriptional regulator [Rhizobiaceae bacterium]MCV0407422.1 LysR family transcriptional regulator [Rhizobiaceae bacterium]
MPLDAPHDPGRDRLLRRGLNLRHLRLLTALDRTGQISAAAARLSISQPAASRLLADLERIAEATLHTRLPRGIELTESGRHLAAIAGRMLSELDAAAREVDEIEAGRRGLVSIGAVTGAALEHVLPVLRQMRVTHPRINANVVVDTSDKLAPLMLAEELDFYIGRIPPSIEASAFVADPIGPEPVVLIVREGHPLLRSGQVGLANCVEFDWVMQPQGGLMRQTVEAYLMDRRISLPARVISTSSTLMTLALIAQSNAIAPIARAAALFFGDRDGLGARIAALPVASDLAVTPYSLLRAARRPLTPVSRLVHGQLLAQLERPAP